MLCYFIPRTPRGRHLGWPALMWGETGQRLSSLAECQSPKAETPGQSGPTPPACAGLGSQVESGPQFVLARTQDRERPGAALERRVISIPCSAFYCHLFVCTRNGMRAARV